MPSGEHHLQFHHVILQLGQAPLQQHMAVVHDAHMMHTSSSSRRLWLDTSTVVPRSATSPIIRLHT